MALNFFSNWVTNLPSATLTAPNREMDLRVGAMSKMGSLSSGGTHMAILDPCCWKWHSSRLQRSRSFLWASLRRFFKSLLLFRVGPSYYRPGFAQTKTQLMEDPLALTNPQGDLLGLFQVMRQKLSIPKILRIAKLSRRLPQVVIDKLQLFWCQPLRASGLLLVFQTAEPMHFKTPYPPLDGRGMMAKHLPHVVTGESLTNQQYAMKAMIIAGFLRTKNFVLQRHFHHLGIGICNRCMVNPSLPLRVQEGFIKCNVFILHYL